MAEVRPEDLARRFAHIARMLLDQDSVNQTLDQIVELAPQTIEGCDAAGIMVLYGHDRIHSTAVTDELARESDKAELEFGGPCVAATWEEGVFQIDDMARETRWPQYVARATELGIGSVLSFQLFTLENTLGAINLFARTPHVYDAWSREVGWIFASHAAVALAGAQQDAQLREAIETRQVIGEAVGIVMERYGLPTRDEGFNVLRRASNELNVKLREVALRVTESGEGPFDDVEKGQ